MFVWMRFSEGLILAHACLIAAYLVGASLLPPYDDIAREESASHRMVHTVCTCGLGFAAIGFASFLLALTGFLNSAAVLLALVACVVAGSLYRRESPFQAAYWVSRVHALGTSWDAPLLGMYYLMLAFAFPAVNLANLGSDPIAYHLAYAADWATSGHLVVDPFLRWAFYANNFLLLDALFLLFHAQVFVMFLVWATGLLTTLGIFAAVRWILADQGVGAVWAAFAALFLTLAVVFAPSYIHWFPSAYIDAPIGAFALLATLSIVIGVRERRRGWLMAAAVTSGFLIGMKGSLLPLVAVFGIALWAAAWSIRLKPSATLALLALLVAASSPWYVRSWIATDDPVWPVLNLALYGHDGLMTQGEEAALAADLPNARSVAAIVALPFRAFFDFSGNDFREPGTSALILALFVPAGILLIMLPLKRNLVKADSLIAVFILCMLVGYWAVISTLLRYSILFTPLLAFCLGTTIGLPFIRLRWRGLIVAALAALTMIPTSGTVDYFRQIYLSQYRYLPQSYLSDSQYQSRFADGYDVEESVAAVLARTRARGRVYVIGWRLDYYFRLHGIQTAGDWVGPAGYFRLYRAVDAGVATEFLDDLGVTAVLLNPVGNFGGFEVPLGRQLTAHGFCEESIPHSEYVLYLQCTKRSAAMSSRNDREHFMNSSKLMRPIRSYSNGPG